MEEVVLSGEGEDFGGEEKQDVCWLHILVQDGGYIWGDGVFVWCLDFGISRCASKPYKACEVQRVRYV